MEKLVITGKTPLKGEVTISGAKNAVVALIPAAILSDEEVCIDNIPNISDTKALIDILDLLNCKIKYQDESLTINTINMNNVVIPEELSKK